MLKILVENSDKIVWPTGSLLVPELKLQSLLHFLEESKNPYSFITVPFESKFLLSAALMMSAVREHFSW